MSQETRARVEAEAQRRGYRPNTFARRLKMGKIDAVGLVFPVRPAPLNNNVFLEWWEKSATSWRAMRLIYC